MNYWRNEILNIIKSFFTLKFLKRRTMYNLKRRRESVALVYRKTTKFLSCNTATLLKKMPNNKKNGFLPEVIEEYQEDDGAKSPEQMIDSDDESHLGDQDLDYYLGIRPKDTFWSDSSGLEQIRKDYLIYHCGVSEEDYERRYRKKVSKPSDTVQPKLKQVPFKIHKKHKKANSLREGMAESWVEKKGIFKLFGNRRDSESTSDSYSECDSNDDAKFSDIINIDCDNKDDGDDWHVTEQLSGFSTTDILKKLMGVRIKEVSEGRPCDNCPEICPGFVSHPWRKTCKSCGCDRLQHSVYHEELVSVRERLGLRDGRGNSYDNNPPGLTAKQSELYWSSLGGAGGAAGGAAARRSWRARALAAQLPQQDLALAHCKHVDDAHRKQFEDFVSARNEIALDIGNALQHHGQTVECEGCTKSIRSGSIAIQAPRISEEAYFHPACFTCSECDELLVELAYCTLDGRLFCVRHYGERLKPRCHSCDELIFSGEYTKAMNKDWHSGHFCCWQCDESLTGQRYVLRDEHPYCIKCYEGVFANGCEECNKIIGIDSKDLSYKDKHWHEACFLCAKCRVSLVDKQFGSKLDKIYCGNCYDAQFASRCDGCGEVFRAGTKKMEYKTRQWHEKCFCCVVCKKAIGTKSFIPREQEIYCAGCYEDKFATRCVKCNKIITQGGVTYKQEPWHRECFTCTHCSTSLAGERFTSRDEKPYCAVCFGELFAKRCTSCTKPITGIGGTRFISFEDRHWHNDCFQCASCQVSLVGKGFITVEQDIICPECAKQKIT